MTAPRVVEKPRAVVLGDLVLDVVLRPAGPLRPGTDVAGRVSFRQGGSAATTARWLAAAGLRAVFITALGRDGLGDALEAYLRQAGVEVHAVHIGGAVTGRLGVLLDPSGERTFVADRGAMLGLRAGHLRAAWFHEARLLHLPAYSLLGPELAAAAARAADLARAAGARVSVDLASAGFLAEYGLAATLERVRRAAPDLLLANAAEAHLVLDGRPPATLLGLAPVVVLKEGAGGARVLARHLEEPLVAAARAADLPDTTGAGDAFDAGFLAALVKRAPRDPAVLPSGAVLTRALAAGHRAAWREVGGRRPEFDPGALRPLRRSAAEG